MSNLFLRCFAHHPKIGVVDCPFDAAYMAGPERQTRRHNPKIDALVKARKEADHHVTYQMAFDEMRERIREIEGEVRRECVVRRCCVCFGDSVILEMADIGGKGSLRNWTWLMIPSRVESP